MTDAPKIPEPTGEAIHRAMRRVRDKHRAVHEHNRRRTAQAYAEGAAPPVPGDGQGMSDAAPGGAV